MGRRKEKLPKLAEEFVKAKNAGMTRTYWNRSAAKLLHTWLDQKRLKISDLSPTLSTELRKYVRSSRKAPTSIKDLSSALTRYLRFLHDQGKIDFYPPFAKSTPTAEMPPIVEQYIKAEYSKLLP